MKCPKCGHEKRETAEFCGQCGESSLANGRYQVKKFLGEGGRSGILSAPGQFFRRLRVERK